ncbi:bifunctional adenosylcobinamide kinase/adenosylcobinamide-phosphate guanylyltransferase [Methylogaea oryzae]|uniref:Bifunctional adenosylcobalamin biosynthesis protein n=1 Tax=Methylogaea oryzae TaxID=1295382 RepID=A0A8D5AJX6_9GAMM|nr:bifunctional adenosylcobinamide kinase/adenosylcobinamide-phosphate guanylyltransferase [Methylogaea oryzae]BBL70516.1 adenosylcobinamide kinase/adenosylcobinamide phosphate guanyltransferase [Methylogaea oryzae]
MIELILGGARSGKSRYAESRAAASEQAVVYLATARAGDDEMAQRIARHRQRREAHWVTVEEPIALAQALSQHCAPQRCVLVDCLTLWLSNVLFDRDGGIDEARFQRERAALLDCLPRLPGRLLLVSNEIGMGVVPMGAATRRFVDEAGWLHQDLAALSRRVVWVVAGLPQVLKGGEGD